MGYWVYLDREGEPITKEELLEFAASDPALRVEDETVIHMFEDNGKPQEQALSMGSEGVEVKYPAPETLVKLAEIARELGGEIQDEDGEVYDLNELLPPEEPKPKASKRSRKAPVPYSPKSTFKAKDTIAHPKFGEGRVVRAAGKQIEVEFRDVGTKKLAHGLS